MKKDITLVILAAGMGSRFGGLKQVTPIGPNGEFIIDYSIYDALKVGFNKVVFIIKKENYEIFKESIGKRIEKHIKVEYVFQELNNLPKNSYLPKERTKPLGTAHALLCCKDIIKEPFAMINADDFYGREAFCQAYNFLKNLDNSINNYGIIGYQLKKTLPANGSVKRGICQVDKDNYLISITESIVEKENDKIMATPLNKRESFTVNKNATTSMNFLLFTPTIFKYIEDLFPNFFEENKENILTAEYLVPIVLEKLIERKEISTKVIDTNANWYGITYKDDILLVKKAIERLIADREYSSNLWN